MAGGPCSPETEGEGEAEGAGAGATLLRDGRFGRRFDAETTPAAMAADSAGPNTRAPAAATLGGGAGSARGLRFDSASAR